MTAVGDANIVILNDAEITALMRDPGGPVGRLLLEKATEGAVIARAVVPVRHGNVWEESTSTGAMGAHPPKPSGYTRRHIHPKLGATSLGQYGSVNAPADPAVFLEHPAEQMHYPRHFLTTALWTMTPV